MRRARHLSVPFGASRIRAGLAFLLFSLVVTTACSQARASSPLRNAKESPEELAEAVLDALADQDREALSALVVTSEERETLIWYELPDSDHMPFGFAEGIRQMNNQKGIGHAFSEFGGQEFEFLRLEFSQEDEVYDNFTLHRGAELWVRRLSDGEEGYLPILDVIIEMKGGWWKLLDVEE